MGERGISMSLDDLDDLDSLDETKIESTPVKVPIDPKVKENTEIFEELVEELDKSTHDEQAAISVKKRANRRSSMGGGYMAPDRDETAEIIHVNQSDFSPQTPAPDMADGEKVPKHIIKPCRRHSSFEPRQMERALQHHKKMKDYLQKLEDKQILKRTNFVEAMLDFNLTVDISMASMGNITDSAAMHFSCPVLSYMGDDEEDSVEMILTSTTKGPSLGVVEEDLSWKGLDFEPETPKPKDVEATKSGGRTYTLELPAEPTQAKKARRMSRGKKTRRPSYKDLELRLESETPQEIIRSFSVNGSLASMKIDDDYVEKPMASGRITSFADDKFARFRSSSDMQAAFRETSAEASLNNHGF